MTEQNFSISGGTWFPYGARGAPTWSNLRFQEDFLLFYLNHRCFFDLLWLGLGFRFGSVFAPPRRSTSSRSFDDRSFRFVLRDLGRFGRRGVRFAYNLRFGSLSFRFGRYRFDFCLNNLRFGRLHFACFRSAFLRFGPSGRNVRVRNPE